MPKGSQGFMDRKTPARPGQDVPSTLGAASLIGMFSSPESGDKEKEVYEASD